METQKQLRQAYMEATGEKPNYVGTVVRLTNGGLLNIIGRVSLETDFCFGWSSFGQGPTIEEAREAADDCRHNKREFFSEYRYTEGNGLRNVYGDEPTKDEIVGGTPITDLRNYPKWQGVVPTPEKRIAVEIRNDLEQVYKEALADAKLLKVKKPEDNVVIRVDGTSWFCARMVKYMLTAGIEGWVRRRCDNTTNDDTDNEQYKLIPNGGNKPFLKEWDGQKLLLMPVAIPSEEEMKEYGWTDSNKYDAEKGVLIREINN